MAVVERHVELRNAHGLHARPISQMVALVQGHQSSLLVRHSGRDADGASILDLMSLGAGPKAELELRAEGDDAEALIQALEALIEGCFGES